MRPFEIRLLNFSAYAFILFVAVGILMPTFACGCKRVTPAMDCLSNLRGQATGMLIYAGDHDDRHPRRDRWMDGIAPYVADLFHDPEVPKGAYGYAFNAALSRAKAPRHAEKVPLVYDSVNPIKNASNPVTSLPSPGRHKGRHAVAHADGHAKRVVKP